MDTLYRGDVGSEVTTLQNNLHVLNYTVYATASYDETTIAAVRLFRQNTWLAPGGEECEQHTFDAIASVADQTQHESPAPSLSSRGVGHEPGGSGYEHRTPQQLKDYILDGTHGVLTVAEIAGMFAEEGTDIAAIGEVAGGFGEFLAVLTVLYSTWHEFGEGLREEENRGAIYGLFWAVIGHPDVEPRYWDEDPYPSGQKQPWDTYEEMTAAFHKGIATGRGSAGDPKTHNQVAGYIAWQVYKNGYDQDAAASMVLNEAWHQASGGSKPTFIDSP